MSDFYVARVVGKTDRSVDIALDVTHPLVARCADPSFALMVLYDSTDRMEHARRPWLAREIREADVGDRDWATRSVRGFIESAVLDGDVLRVTVTHSAWLQHLEVGATWPTSALMVTRAYLPCPPCVPSARPCETKESPLAVAS